MNVNAQDDKNKGPTRRKRKPISELARDAYEKFIKMQECVRQFEDKMSECIDTLLCIKIAVFDYPIFR